MLRSPRPYKHERVMCGFSSGPNSVVGGSQTLKTRKAVAGIRFQNRTDITCEYPTRIASKSFDAMNSDRSGRVLLNRITWPKSATEKIPQPPHARSDTPQRARLPEHIGRASCRDRVCQYVEIRVVALS